MKPCWNALMGLALMSALAGLTGCGDDGGSSSGSGGDPALVGSWRMSAMSVNGGGFFSPADISWDVRVQMNADGSASVTEVWQGSTESSSGGWDAAGGQLTLSAGWYDWTGPYRVSGNQFTLSNIPDYDGEGHTGSFIFNRI